MRFWFIIICLVAVLANSGCQTFSKSSKSNGLFGNKNKRNRGMSEDLSQEVLDPLGARNTNRLLLDDLHPSQIGTTLKTRGKRKQDEQEALKYYDQGIATYSEGVKLLEDNPTGTGHQKLFVEAANQFRTASAFYPDSALEENALYYEGESYFFADRYVQANRAFEKLVAYYAGTRYLDYAEQRRLAIALYWFELSEKYRGPKFGDPKRPRTGLAGEARRVMHRIRIDDPTGRLADDATLALGKAFMAVHRYYEAADTFEDLRRNYPGSKHQFAAHILELEARLKGYQGPSYDDTPLRKAEELMQTIVRQFPQQARENLQYLEAQNTRVQNLLVERDYTTGQYFANRGENRAAIYVYDQMAKKYENTELSQTIQEQIAELEQKPPVPKQQAKWLVDLFPKRDDHIPLIAAGDNETVFK